MSHFIFNKDTYKVTETIYNYKVTETLDVDKPAMFSELDYINIVPVEYVFVCFKSEYNEFDDYNNDALLKHFVKLTLPLTSELTTPLTSKLTSYKWLRFNLSASFVFTEKKYTNTIWLKIISNDKYKIIKLKYSSGYIQIRQIDNIWLPASDNIRIEVVKIIGYISSSWIDVSIDAII